jgi:hypothetical protein
VPAERRGAKEAQGHPLEDVTLIGFRDLETLESYPGALHGLLVTVCRGTALSAEQQWGAITTLPVRPPAEVLTTFDAYDDRSLVENTPYRELTQGYRLPTFIGKDASSIAAPSFFEVVWYSVIALYQQQRAYRYVVEGVRRLRRGVWKERWEVVGYVGCWYGLFEIREFATLLGRPPTGRLDATRGPAPASASAVGSDPPEESPGPLARQSSVPVTSRQRGERSPQGEAA